MQSFTIEVLIVNSLVCWGVRFAFMDGNILHPIRRLYEAVLVRDTAMGNFFDMISEPLWGCVMCMSSFWGIAFTLANGGDIANFRFLFYVFALCGLNWLMSFVVEALVSCNNKNTVK